MKVEGSRCWCWWTRRLKSSGDSIEHSFVDLDLLGLFNRIIDLLAVDAASSREEGCIRVWKLTGVIEKAEQLHGWCTSAIRSTSTLTTEIFFTVILLLDLKEMPSVGSAIHWLFASAFWCMGCVSILCSFRLGCSIAMFIREFIRSSFKKRWSIEWWHDCLDDRPTQNRRKTKGLIASVSGKIRSKSKYGANLIVSRQVQVSFRRDSLQLIRTNQLYYCLCPTEKDTRKEIGCCWQSLSSHCLFYFSAFFCHLIRTLFQIWIISFFEI